MTGAKVYLVASVADVYAYCINKKKPSMYEMIDHEACHHLYFDMDRAVWMSPPPKLAGLDPDDYACQHIRHY
ncbi:hypothetical protein K3495_g13490 [Podosphaera aphanis]|nr:hypothetical protein K3495_g13490 [Podosphaera aphanis]